MSQEEKKGLLEKTTTRREFLKLTGKGIVGATVSFSILSLFGCSKNPEDVTGFALAKGLLIADKSKCTGCQRCEISCTLNNDGKIQPYISRVKVSRNYNFGTDGPKLPLWSTAGQFGNLKMTPETCQQCKDPKCAAACPQKAIYADPKTGARIVNEEKCVGCGTCTQACPWNLPTVDPETKKSKKCFACGICASNCPTGALKIVPWEEVKSVLRRNGYEFA